MIAPTSGAPNIRALRTPSWVSGSQVASCSILKARASESGELTLRFWLVRSPNKFLRRPPPV
jgi:hypothetical protein